MRKCKCGCGQEVSLSTRTWKKTSKIKGEPNIFVFGHQNIGRKFTEEHKQKISIAHIGQHYNKGIIITEEHKRKISEAKIGKPCSEETKRKISETLKGHPCYKNIERNKKISISKKIIQKRMWKNQEYREKQLNSIFKGFELKPNKPEKIIIDLIKQNNFPFNYVGNGKLWFRGETHSFNPDFLSKNPKHIIELFGDYWHNREDYKKRDKERLETYNKYGYKTLVIWEHELNNLKFVLNKIEAFVDER